MQHHIASSKRVGLTTQDWQDLKASIYDRFSPDEQAALRFADKLTLDLAHINDADIAALKQHFKDDQILDLDMLIGLINLTNRLTDPMGADLETPPEKI
jgi:alkylhydroperoxidase family enzyme